MEVADETGLIVPQEPSYVFKLKKYFKDSIVYKSPSNNKFFSNLNIPVFIRDWLVMRFMNEDGSVDQKSVSDFIKKYVPDKTQWKSLLVELLRNEETVKFLGRIKIDFNTKSKRALFSLPDFNFPNDKNDAVADWDVINQNHDCLLTQADTWGIIEIKCVSEKTQNKEKNIFKLCNFTPFCPYKINFEYYSKMREQFSLDEWIDVMISSFDYSPEGYHNQTEKFAMIKRMLPFLEKRLNLVELAPKETGKSYVFSQISKYGWLVSGGSISRSQLFYDISKKTDGLISRFDFVAFDEVQSIRFNDPSEMQGILKCYLESGEYHVGSARGKGEAGLILLGNIAGEHMSVECNMFEELPLIFRESALVDRFHGFIKGWEIPKMREELKVNNWALNTEYVSEMFHLMRNDDRYRRVVDSLIYVPENSATRDTEAVKRLSTAFLKLLFPNAIDTDKIDKNQFEVFCLRPALEMRGIIKKQLAVIDPIEFKGAQMPFMRIR